MAPLMGTLVGESARGTQTERETQRQSEKRGRGEWVKRETEREKEEVRIG